MNVQTVTPGTRDIIGASGVGFGTSGARGLVTQLSDEVCAAFALAFVAAIAERFPIERVAVGWDLRPSSPRIAAACMAAVRSMGLGVDCCGMLPTPALALHAMSRGIPAVMVTGSHIPFDRNGLKFYRPDGEIDKSDEAAMLAIDLPLPRLAPAGTVDPVNPEASDAYVARYLDFFPPDLLKGARIGFYQHSSASRDVLSTILRGTGAEVTELGRTDEFVPIDTEAVAETDVVRGRAWARTHRFDAIVSTDGDGDRPLLGDERGEWLRGDIVGLLCARALGIDALAVPVSCNTAIESCDSFRTVVRTRIGSPHVIAGMQGLANVGRVAGFEANGGFLLGCEVASPRATLAPLPTRDAALPILAVLALAARERCALSQLVAGLPSRHTASDRLQDFPAARSRGLLAQFAKHPGQLLALAGLHSTAPGIDETDGLRLVTADGDIVHLRPSGNAPELRCYAEAGTAERARELVELVLGSLRGTQDRP